jgi:carboxyl-terminal processing protease
MKKRTALLCFLAAASVFAADVEPQNYYGRIAQRFAAMLPKRHVLQCHLDDTVSQRAWTNLISSYDFDHSVFLASDLEAFASRSLTLDDELRAGDVSFGYDVYRLYCRRLGERIDFATNLLAAAEWDFSSNETYRVKRKDQPWPATREEAEAQWRARMKNEVLFIVLSRELDALEAGAGAETNAPPESPEQLLAKKYRQYCSVLSEPDEEAVLQHYLSAVARAYDPHSDYMSPALKEDFDMDMNLTLCGVGAVLSMEDGALKIVEVMPGGPVDRDGRIREGDRIVGVRQGDGPMEDVMWQPMKKSIKKIRGPKGTRVTLEIVSRDDPTGSVRKRYELVRDEIKLEDQAATGRVERVTLPDGGVRKLGYVHLPGFYATMDKRPGEPGFRSCSRDVAAYVADFNAQGAEGLVLDLRGNGGGSLREAVLLSALFVSSGPVVQIRDTHIVQPLAIPARNPVAFRKPVVVLVDRASASASEIVAGHLRDCGRAIVLGDTRTHGKGTVQSVMGMGPEKYGSMKITTARFYRVNGASTQIRGVESDIRLPSILDSLDIGEDRLPNALAFTRIAPVPFAPAWDLDRFIPELSALSAARLAGDERYARHLRRVAGMKEIEERESVPLDAVSRRKMMVADRSLRDPDEDGDEGGPRRRREKARKDDVVLDEAFSILSDLVRLNGGRELPPTRADWFDAIFGT